MAAVHIAGGVPRRSTAPIGAGGVGAPAWYLTESMPGAGPRDAQPWQTPPWLMCTLLSRRAYPSWNRSPACGWWASQVAHQETRGRPDEGGCGQADGGSGCDVGGVVPAAADRRRSGRRWSWRDGSPGVRAESSRRSLRTVRTVPLRAVRVLGPVLPGVRAPAPAGWPRGPARRRCRLPSLGVVLVVDRDQGVRRDDPVEVAAKRGRPRKGVGAIGREACAGGREGRRVLLVTSRLGHVRDSAFTKSSRVMFERPGTLAAAAFL
ncbi:hypothetical protein J2Z77_001851 [Streptomyces avidinii]|uniref:Uncharacterized protein n=1 Tax=Streptomyces avidinii TaxID=1895 RepID=A0ABS4L1A9_STRAV|nr:hypothetical protein [Streptomyces avidinii]